VPKLRLLVPVALLVSLTLPGIAHATLAFVRKPLHPQIWIAEDSGRHAHRLAAGVNPRISPNGKLVAYSPPEKRDSSPEIVIRPTDGSGPVTQFRGEWREPYVFAWAPDSSAIALLSGDELQRRTLNLIDVACARGESERTCLHSTAFLAKGYFNGVSFSPDGKELVYGRAGSERYPPRSDIYRVEVGGGKPVRLTKDHRSTNPVWGPNGEIVFVKQLGAKKRRYTPKNELFTMTPAGGKVRQLTHTRVSPLAVGLTPTAFSPSGNRLLAQFGGQDLTYAVAVNPRNGRQRPLVEATEQGFVGTGFTANGKRVIGTDGGFEFGNGTNVATVPYPHGKPKILARHAFEPSLGGD
jgi:hypothetical protein